jgi:hypothetical protein
VQPNLNYLLFTGKINGTSRLWVQGINAGFTAIDSSEKTGQADPAYLLPALCTQTAPYSSKGVQDTSEKWRVEVEANNQTLTGYVLAEHRDRDPS